MSLFNFDFNPRHYGLDYDLDLSADTILEASFEAICGLIGAILAIPFCLLLIVWFCRILAFLF